MNKLISGIIVFLMLFSASVFSQKLNLATTDWEPPYKSSNLYCPISKKRMDGKIIIKKFNEALKDMKADGSYDAILKRFGQT